MARLLSIVLASLVACLQTIPGARAASSIRHVFVITMENRDLIQISGNAHLAPYIQNSHA